MSAERVEKAVEKLIRYCGESGEPPTGFTLREVCGLSEEVLRELRELAYIPEKELLKLPASARQKRRKLRRALDRLDEFRTQYWLKLALDNPRLASFAVFNLKQPANGGLGDRPSAQTELAIRLEGVGEGAFE